jgi:hypothetical protein
VAAVTDRILTLGQSFLEITYDDVTFNLVSARLVCTEATTFRISRKNGSIWREVTIGVTDQTIAFPQGPIRNLDDIPVFGVMG